MKKGNEGSRQDEITLKTRLTGEVKIFTDINDGKTMTAGMRRGNASPSKVFNKRCTGHVVLQGKTYKENGIVHPETAFSGGSNHRAQGGKVYQSLWIKGKTNI